MSSGSWFDGARLGLFVHWDHASQQGLELSWPLVGGVFALPAAGDVAVAQYHSSAATFDPQAWDPVALARLAKEAGARYGVLTTKHHSGYAMWPTKLSDWSIANSPYEGGGGDIVGSFVDAFRAEGLRIGLYFSLSDWHHPDYPAFEEGHKPYRFGMSPPRPDDATWNRYLDFMFGQITELLTEYGQIDLVWFDGGWERPDWRSGELVELMRSLQPGIIINDRLPGAGDYTTPEQFVPAQAPAGRWETCLTMNRSWGYNPGDTAYKSPRSLVHTICQVAGAGGNLLLNVSPRGDGSLPPEQVERLQEIGAWMGRHGRAVWDTTPGLAPYQWYGPSTRAGGDVHLMALMRPYDSVEVRDVKVRRVRGVRDLASGRELKWRSITGLLEGLTPDPDGTVTIAVPEDVVDPLATVITLEMEGQMAAGGGQPVYDPDDVTPEWLGQVLSSAGAIAGRRVTAADAAQIGTGQVGCNIRYRLTYDGPGAGPDSVVGKFASRSEDSRAAGVQTLTYETEVAFYRDLADTVDVSRPGCFFASVEPGTADVVLILEDIDAPAGDQLAGCSNEQARAIVVEAAKLHGPRWGDPTLREVPWLASKLANAFDPGPVTAMMWPTFIDRYRGTLTAESIEVGTRMSEAKTWLEPDPARATICHCDYRLDNMLFGDPGGSRPVTIVDWQTVQLGNGVSDVSYFISAAMEPPRRRAEERELVAAYYTALSAYDIGDYSFEQCWDDYRRHAFGGFFMAVFASVVVGRTERGDAMFMKMANGAAAQVVDLGALDFLSR